MKAAFPLLLAASLAGCATTPSSRYPSLLPRAIEGRSDAEPATPPAAIAAPDPSTDATIAETRRTLDANATAFAVAASRAEQSARAARGAAVGSDPWIAAQSALAELDGYRATTSTALTDLEQLALARAAAGQPAYPALDTLRRSAQDMLAAQEARIVAIQRSLPAA